MTILITGLAVFFAGHLYSAFRTRGGDGDIRQRLGFGPYMIGFSVFSLIGLVLIAWGYGAARPAPVLYEPPVWGRHLNYLLMWLSLVALVAAYAPKGVIARALRHPFLVAVKIWAVGHLLANGDLASLILFGAFLAYAVIDRIAVKRRGDLGAGTVTHPAATGDVVAVVGGTLIYAAMLLGLHRILFGVGLWPVV